MKKSGVKHLILCFGGVVVVVLCVLVVRYIAIVSDSPSGVCAQKTSQGIQEFMFTQYTGDDNQTAIVIKGSWLGTAPCNEAVVKSALNRDIVARNVVMTVNNPDKPSVEIIGRETRLKLTSSAVDDPVGVMFTVPIVFHDARLVTGNKELKSDTIRYNGETIQINARGHCVLKDGGKLIKTYEIEGDLWLASYTHTKAKKNRLARMLKFF